VHLDLVLTAAGAFVGFVVGLTGMGGGALMTPVLVLFFGIPPLAAVSNDLVVSAVMKPVGALVHLRRGTVNLRLVGWLSLGSVPCAFAGVLVSRALGPGTAVQQVTRVAIGIALLAAAAGLIMKAYLSLRERARGAGQPLPEEPSRPIAVRPVPTLVIGAIGGLVVGMTSVGSGSLIIVALLLLYPALTARSLVGTDLLQAVPLVFSAAIGHLVFGDFRPGLTASLLIGSLPGVYLGAMVSARAPSGIVRRALALVLLASGMKLLDASNAVTIVVLVAVVVVGSALWMAVRRAHGFPATYRVGRRLRRLLESGPAQRAVPEEDRAGG
jgi:uncharacterized membrane protein YfcA